MATNTSTAIGARTARADARNQAVGGSAPAIATVTLKAMRDHRRSTLIMSGAMFLTGIYTSLLFPEFGTDAIADLVGSMPEFLQEIIGDAAEFTTPEGFFATEVYAFLGAWIMIAFSIALGIGAIAGEEEGRTLDQLITNPISRRRVYAEKLLAMGALLTLPIIAVGVALIVGAASRDYSFSLTGLLAQSVSLYLLSLAVGCMAMGVGAWTGSKSTALAVSASIAGVGYLLNLVAPAVDWLEPTQYASIIYYFDGDTPFLNGITPWHAAVLLVVASLFAVSGGIAFDRRDLR